MDKPVKPNLYPDGYTTAELMAMMGTTYQMTLDYAYTWNWKADGHGLNRRWKREDIDTFMASYRRTPEGYVTMEQAAAILGVCRTSAREYARRHNLRTIPIHGMKTHTRAVLLDDILKHKETRKRKRGRWATPLQPQLAG